MGHCVLAVSSPSPPHSRPPTPPLIVKMHRPTSGDSGHIDCPQTLVPWLTAISCSLLALCLRLAQHVITVLPTPVTPHESHAQQCHPKAICHSPPEIRIEQVYLPTAVPNTHTHPLAHSLLWLKQARSGPAHVTLCSYPREAETQTLQPTCPYHVQSCGLLDSSLDFCKLSTRPTGHHADHRCVQEEPGTEQDKPSQAAGELCPHHAVSLRGGKWKPEGKATSQNGTTRNNNSASPWCAAGSTLGRPCASDQQRARPSPTLL